MDIRFRLEQSPLFPILWLLRVNEAVVIIIKADTLGEALDVAREWRLS